ncbi:MAG: FliM/FliN family flagellar motor switch protein [Sphingomonadales bacterium]|nr:FliM/FliN family flagellar motor switch protein [Sphingomonadales bacterium]
MTAAAATDWLPDSAFVEPRLLERLDGAITSWSARWFGARNVQRFGKAETVGGGGRGPAARDWRQFAPGVWIACGLSGGMALARHALALGTVQPRTSGADERLLTHYADTIARDLATALAELVGARGPMGDGQAGPGRGIAFKVRAVDDGPVVQVALEAGILTRFRKQLCPPWRAPAAGKTLLSTALTASPVRVEASLGVTTMSALDLRNIAVDDVIILDRRTDEPVLLRAVDGGAPLTGARIERGTGDCIVLKAS